ncbi:hypothetical protein GCK72_009570 [Caenorhabditis remanei]|uniref:Uncharacterized protein n=1 Tax=Caenorhabditis remanei TaxID=31234 RepID=A0A6A5H3F0_CAERE|nr:hypothetical protein GCK72_009570 [Caenorhabditis remanei]KAF1761314.1 hypothetical protein GCK72_009570 [Caenorhabditis remanei]
MFLCDPNPHLRVYFLFYLSLLTLPTAYVVVFGERVWMKIAFISQLIRLVFVGLHNAFYPIFVAAYVAVGFEGTHPGASADEILFHSVSYGVMIFFMSMTASLWEPAKLYQIYRLQKMLETSRNGSLAGSEADIDEDEEELASVSETESTNLSDSGYVAQAV